MAPQPQRREQRRTHLDASVVPVERALLARADTMDKGGVLTTPNMNPELVAMVELVLAAEFREMAEELHWH